MENLAPPPMLKLVGPIQKPYVGEVADTTRFNLILQVFEFFTDAAQSDTVLRDLTATFYTTERRRDQFPSADLRLRLREQLLGGSRAPPVNIDDVVEEIITKAKDPAKSTGSVIFQAHRLIPLENEVFDAEKSRLLASKRLPGGPMKLDLDQNCIVCTETFDILEDQIVIMPCRFHHLSHRSCAKAWCHLCPECRFPLPSRSPREVIVPEIANPSGKGPEGGDSSFNDASSSSSGGEGSSCSKSEGSVGNMSVDL